MGLQPAEWSRLDLVTPITRLFILLPNGQQLDAAWQCGMLSTMRFVLALLAVMALLVSPVTTAVAQASCNHQVSTASSKMDMAPMPGMDGAGVKAPNGDHSAKHSKTTGLGCAQACAGACAVTVALAPPLKTAAFASMQAEVPMLRAAVLHPYEPQGLKRPPKSIG